MSLPPVESCLKISIDSRLDQVFLVSHAVRGICSQLGLEKILVYKLELAVVEAVNNTIKHAYGSRPGHVVEVIITVSRERIRFEICDAGEVLDLPKGERFNYNPRDRKGLPEGGMGLQIIQEVMDEITYHRRGELNCLSLGKRLE